MRKLLKKKQKANQLKNFKMGIIKKILLVNAHGVNTPGKRSPDGKFREYKWSREIVNDFYEKLINHQDIMDAKTQVIIINPNDKEMSNVEILRRCNVYGTDALVLPVHVNAAGIGAKWMNARGFSVWTTKGQTASDPLAQICFDFFAKEFGKEFVLRQDKVDGDSDWEENFTVLMNVGKAFLIEVGFQDNQQDVALIDTPGFKQRLVDNVLVPTILKILSL